MTSEPDDRDCPVFAVSRRLMLSILHDGTIVPWSVMLDHEAEPTEDAAEAKYAVHPIPTGESVVLDISLFEPATLH